MILCKIFLLFTGLSVILTNESYAQSPKSDIKYQNPVESYFKGLEWRQLGPFRGGRSAAVTGVPGKPNLYYMGSTGGGVWKTKDGGQTWVNISDSAFGGSIGAVAVSEYDPNVIYVGGGEVTVRGNVSFGNGIWKSTDAGKTWHHKGLPDSRHIPRIRIHPRNPDLVYAAVLGDLYKSSEERGVYRSKDGGENWEKILFSTPDAGAFELIMDPGNPRILYASTWRIRRTPYSLESGGQGSALWKSTDAGDSWRNITRAKGLPQDTVGVIGITVSPVNPDRVWVQVESQKGGLFRSEDGGKTWAKINESRSLRQRAWYYSRIYADSKDEDILYVLNVQFHKSKDGGKSFKTIRTPHGDHHDFWIAPEDNQRMIIGDDGGAQVSFDGGDNFSTYYNQPTAQFYRITTDNHFPYRIYGAQQDNSTVRILHRSNGGSIGEREWEPSAGGESAHMTIKPDDNDIVVGGSYGGFLTWKNHKTGESRAINVWPDNPLGYGAEGMRYRFQWNFPVFFSPHNPNRLYAASNHLHLSTDLGNSWRVVSPDLTRNDPEKLVSSGGPITKDNTGVEYYCTIFSAVESPEQEGLIWVGTDDGRVHITYNGGNDWTEITPKGMPEWMQINSIELDPYNKGGAFLAGTRYKLGDYLPYIYRTSDYGKTWKKLTTGIDKEDFVRVVRSDPGKKGLLYAGTESGLYLSLDDGTTWNRFQNGLPLVPITDMTIKDGNLIVATQGRSFWILDDLNPLRNYENGLVNRSATLFPPLDSYRMPGFNGGQSRTKGQNHPGGVMVHFHLKDKPDTTKTITLAFLNANDELIREFSTTAKEKRNKLKLKQGFNRYVWDMRYPPAKEVKGMILWWSTLNGPKVIPGNYKVRLTLGDREPYEQPFKILKDPRSATTSAEMQAQFDFLMKIRDKMTETHEGILKLRDARSQIQSFSSRIDTTHKDVKAAAKAILDTLQSIESTLYQTKLRSAQDPLNYPIKLNNKLGHLSSLSGIGDHAPTVQMEAFRKEASERIDEQLRKLKEVFDKDIPAFNETVRKGMFNTIMIKEENPGD